MITMKFYLPLRSVEENWSYLRKSAVMQNMAKKQGFPIDAVEFFLLPNTKISYFEVNYSSVRDFNVDKKVDYQKMFANCKLPKVWHEI